MVNRIEKWLRERDVPGNYWIVCTEVGNFAVTRTQAERVMDMLEDGDKGRWVAFTDLFGSRHRIRGKRIDGVWESTVEQRLRERRFRDERRKEREDDCNPWDEE